ncbi:hypothetical protein SRB5_24730 [Streptomyces sp. RB5]|uniref:MSP domain-containing protein n=1 Tax=Streptomyces smaragdinus TaxID=2585196 RepID=A0A7K0CFT5_9ACTN|nr:hypothetical protein [Streptomyces smaragdinus]MQY12340.1 hypothetical protein [Streptomyces smaragdinus]
MPTPDDEAVYLRAAADLARMTTPDLSSFSANTIDVAMLRVFTPTGPDPDWLHEFRGRLKQASSNEVHLTPAAPDEFPAPHDKSPAASYHRLVDTSTDTTLFLVMGPFNPPFRLAPEGG